MVTRAAPNRAFCIRKTKVVYVKAGCGVTVASEMGRMAYPGDRDSGGVTAGIAISQMAQPCADGAGRGWFAQCPHG